MDIGFVTPTILSKEQLAKIIEKIIEHGDQLPEDFKTAVDNNNMVYTVKVNGKYTLVVDPTKTYSKGEF